MYGDVPIILHEIIWRLRRVGVPTKSSQVILKLGFEGWLLPLNDLLLLAMMLGGKGSQ